MIYVAEEATDQVAIFDTASGKVTKSIKVADAPSGLALSADGARLYVTCAGPVSTVCVVDTASRKVWTGSRRLSSAVSGAQSRRPHALRLQPLLTTT